MPETKQLLRETRDRIAPPPDVHGGLERRRRHQENVKRAAAAAVAIVVALVGLGGWFLLERDAAPRPADRSEELGIFAPGAGRIVYGNRLGIWGVDPAAPADPATTVQLSSEAGIPLGWSSDGTRLLILREQLFVLHADGSETQVTEGPKEIRSATISPDGSRVVFAAVGGLYTVDADGGPAEILLEAGEDPAEAATFAPDGTQIAYVVGSGDHSHRVWLMDADGSDTHQILANETTMGAGHVYGFAWSPAGDRIALGLEGATYTFATDGSDFTRVIGLGDRPFWSPDGSQLAYAISCLGDPEGCGLGVADADGSNVRTFDFASSGPWYPVPSTADEPPPADDPSGLRRDGEILVFEELGTGQGWNLAAQDPGTGEVRMIVETDGIIDCPDLDRCVSFVRRAEWSPDGRWVAFEVSFGDLDRLPWGPCGPTAGVWAASALGEPRQLTTPCEATPGAEGIEELWAWSPVDARLAYVRVLAGSDKLYVIDPSDGSRSVVLSAGDADVNAIEWSPDGTRIAVAIGSTVFVVPAEGGDLPSVGDAFDDVVEIAWSPDGTQLMIQDQGRYRMQVVNADGSDLHLLLEGEDACCETEWSPAGDRIVYQLSIENGTPSFDSEVWTVAPDGSDRIKVFDSDGCGMGATADALPVWAPNGTQVAYNACGVWVVSNADGTGAPQPIDELVHRSWAGGALSGWDLL